MRSNCKSISLKTQPHLTHIALYPELSSPDIKQLGHNIKIVSVFCLSSSLLSSREKFQSLVSQKVWLGVAFTLEPLGPHCVELNSEVGGVEL